MKYFVSKKGVVMGAGQKMLQPGSPVPKDFATDEILKDLYESGALVGADRVELTDRVANPTLASDMLEHQAPKSRAGESHTAELARVKAEQEAKAREEKNEKLPNQNNPNGKLPPLFPPTK